MDLVQLKGAPVPVTEPPAGPLVPLTGPQFPLRDPFSCLILTSSYVVGADGVGVRVPIFAVIAVVCPCPLGE